LSELYQRDNRIDILRALAILCIILAHSAPPDAIFQLRNFDVTMMAFLMGASFYLSSQKHGGFKYLSYIKKRYNRLVLPAWQFLIFFFVLFYGISLYFKDSFYFSSAYIIQSFMMIQGYMWIMAVFFIIALINPLLLFVSSKIKSNTFYFLIVIGAYVFYSVILFVYDSFSEGLFKHVFEYYIAFGLGYSLVAAIGVRLFKIHKSHLIILSGLSLFIYVVLMIYHGFAPTQEFKYPPTLYYFSYGLFVSFLLFYVLSFNKIRRVFDIKPVSWLSTHSLTLYYYHTIPIFILKLFAGRLPMIDSNFVTRFIFLFVPALLLVFLHNGIKRTIMNAK